MRKGIQSNESGEATDRRRAWLWAGAGLGTLAAVAYGLWARRRRGEPPVKLEDVLDRCRDAAMMLDQALTGNDGASTNGAHVR